MTRDENEIEKSYAEIVKHFVNLFHFYLKSRNEEIEISSRNGIITLFRKTNDLVNLSNPEEHEKVKQLLDKVPDANSRKYSEIVVELELDHVEKTPIVRLSDRALVEMQEKHPEFAVEYTRSIF